MKSYRTFIKPAHRDLAAYFDAISPRDRVRFVEHAIINYAMSQGRSVIEETLGRRVFEDCPHKTLTATIARTRKPKQNKQTPTAKEPSKPSSPQPAPVQAQTGPEETSTDSSSNIKHNFWAMTGLIPGNN